MVVAPGADGALQHEVCVRPPVAVNCFIRIWPSSESGASSGAGGAQRMVGAAIGGCRETIGDAVKGQDAQQRRDLVALVDEGQQKMAVVAVGLARPMQRPLGQGAERAMADRVELGLNLVERGAGNGAQGDARERRPDRGVGAGQPAAIIPWAFRGPECQ